MGMGLKMILIIWGVKAGAFWESLHSARPTPKHILPPTPTLTTVLLHL